MLLFSLCFGYEFLCAHSHTHTLSLRNMYVVCREWARLLFGTQITVMHFLEIDFWLQSIFDECQVSGRPTSALAHTKHTKQNKTKAFLHDKINSIIKPFGDAHTACWFLFMRFFSHILSVRMCDNCRPHKARKHKNDLFDVCDKQNNGFSTKHCASILLSTQIKMHKKVTDNDNDNCDVVNTDSFPWFTHFICGACIWVFIITHTHCSECENIVFKRKTPLKIRILHQ